MADDDLKDMPEGAEYKRAIVRRPGVAAAQIDTVSAAIGGGFVHLSMISYQQKATSFAFTIRHQPEGVGLQIGGTTFDMDVVEEAAVRMTPATALAVASFLIKLIRENNAIPTEEMDKALLEANLAPLKPNA